MLRGLRRQSTIISGASPSFNFYRPRFATCSTNVRAKRLLEEITDRLAAKGHIILAPRDVCRNSAIFALAKFDMSDTQIIDIVSSKVDILQMSHEDVNSAMDLFALFGVSTATAVRLTLDIGKNFKVSDLSNFYLWQGLIIRTPEEEIRPFSNLLNEGNVAELPGIPFPLFDAYKVLSNGRLVNGTNVTMLLARSLLGSIRTLLRHLVGRGLSTKHFDSMLESCSDILHLTPAHVDQTFEVLLDFFTQKQCLYTISHHPDLLLRQPDDLRSKYEFLHLDMGLSNGQVSQSRWFEHPLSKMELRFECACRCGVYEIPDVRQERQGRALKHNPKLRDIIDSSDEAFARHVCHISMEEYRIFSEMYARQVHRFETQNPGLPDTSQFIQDQQCS